MGLGGLVFQLPRAAFRWGGSLYRQDTAAAKTVKHKAHRHTLHQGACTLSLLVGWGCVISPKPGAERALGWSFDSDAPSSPPLPAAPPSPFWQHCPQALRHLYYSRALPSQITHL